MTNRSWGYRVSRLVVVLASSLVPRRRRRQWREDWQSELWHGNERTDSKLVRHSAGAVSHALWLRASDYRSGGLLQDVRYGIRSLRNQPGFTATALVVLTLGIGANTTIFSVVNGLLVRPLGGVTEPERLVGVWRVNQGGAENWSYPNYLGIREATDAFTGAVAFADTTLTLRGDDAVDVIAIQTVSRDYFDVLGVDMRQGAGLSSIAETPDVVLSHGTWQRRFGGRDLVGETVELNGVALHVAGIAGPGFLGLTRSERPEAWVCADLELLLGLRQQPSLQEVGWSWLRVVARVAPGVSSAGVRASVDLAMERLREQPLNVGVAAVIAPADGIDPDDKGEARLVLGMLMGIVGLLLLIACANVANLLMARGTGRAQEYGVRLAIGASRGRLMRQLLVEGLVLSLIAAVAAVLVAQWSATLMMRLFETMYETSFSVVVSPDLTMVAFSIGVSVASVLVFGLIPAYRAAGRDVALSIATGGAGSGSRRARMSHVMVAGQVALSIVVLIVAVLFVRSVRALQEIDLGMQTEQLLVLTPQSFDVAPNRDSDWDEGWRVDLAERLGSMPDIEAVSWVERTPLGGRASRRSVSPTAGNQEMRQVGFSAVGPGYFRTVGIALLAGRGFASADDRGAPRVVIVNRIMAELFWPGEDPLGRSVFFGNMPLEVVGVAAPAKYSGPAESPQPFFYTSLGQQSVLRPTLMVRVSGDPEAVVPRVRTIVDELPGDVVARNLSTMNEVVAAGFGQQIVFARVVGLFGLVALVLTVAGVFGLTSYLVNRRTREIGIRIAIGAPAGSVTRDVMRSTLVVALVGVGLGCFLAAATAPALSSLIPGVEPTDGPTFVIASAALLLSVAIAGLIPALRASRVDPLIALRTE